MLPGLQGKGRQDQEVFPEHSSYTDPSRFPYHRLPILLPHAYSFPITDELATCQVQPYDLAPCCFLSLNAFLLCLTNFYSSVKGPLKKNPPSREPL